VKAVETNLLDMAPSINENIARQFTSVVNFFWEWISIFACRVKAECELCDECFYL